MIYTIDNDLEKIHVFQHPQLHHQLYRELVEGEYLMMDFSTELWDSYLDKLQHISDEVIE